MRVKFRCEVCQHDDVSVDVPFSWNSEKQIWESKGKAFYKYIEGMTEFTNPNTYARLKIYNLNINPFDLSEPDWFEGYCNSCKRKSHIGAWDIEPVN